MDGSTYPDVDKGNFILAGHSGTAYFSYFKNLPKLDIGDVAYVYYKGGRYGYKLIAEEKHTRQRDTILRLCYAARMSLDETQRALKYYRMPELYAKIPRDALIMICFNERPGSIIDVNSYLKNNGMDVLRSSGVQE